MSILKIEDVSYHYKNSDRDVLKNVNANFEGGKFYAIVGPSGSGKTTLLSIMAGLDSPKSGKLFVEGKDLKTINPDRYRRENITMIFQAFQLFPLLTALENVCYPMQEAGKKHVENNAIKILENIGIDKSKHNRYPANLSGGEQQRVAIARAIATEAKIILADEPTGNLDTKNSEAIVQILRDLAHKNNYCVITVTHDLEIAALADIVYKMNDGVLTCSL